jgi:hypothetical protein
VAKPSSGANSMRSLQEYIYGVRDFIDEPEDGESDFGDSRLTKHINREIIQIAGLINNKREDYFGSFHSIPLVNSTYHYSLSTTIVRFVELFKGASVTSVGNGVYTYDERGDHYELPPIASITDKDSYAYNPNMMTVGGAVGYKQFGRKLIIGTGTPDILTGNYLRLWTLPIISHIHYGNAVSVTDNTIVIRRANIATDSESENIGDIKQESNAYINYGISIYSATTGAGQERLVIGDSFDGTNHTLTLNDDWDTNPTGTIVYSLVPPFGEDFDDALIAGAAMRSKIKVEDSLGELSQIYQTALNNALANLVPMNRHGTRRVRRVVGL